MHKSISDYDLSQKDIPGFPGYKVNINGNVYSYLQRKPIHHKGHAGAFSCIWYISPIVIRKLKPGKDPKGRLKVSLSKNKKSYNRTISRLVLETFKGNRPEGMECCHNDGNPANNRLENLRWDTRSSNYKDRVKHGTDNGGEKNGNAKLNKWQVQKIRLLKEIDPKMTASKLAKFFKVTVTHIYYILNYKTWKNIR